MASFRRKNTEKAGLWRQLERCESLTPVSPKVNNPMSEYTSVEERVMNCWLSPDNSSRETIVVLRVE
ncbi:hypothetical protein [Endozoicomonas sp. 2B-B]